jgi:hypothetical protein
MGTIVVGGIVALVLALIIAGLVRSARRGNTCGCGSCPHCGGKGSAD